MRSRTVWFYGIRAKVSDVLSAVRQHAYLSDEEQRDELVRGRVAVKWNKRPERHKIETKI